MVARLDHITVVAPSLEAGTAYVEAVLGVTPGAGRKHPAMATHNLLLDLGSGVYLEVIAPDPQAVPVQRPRWFGIDRVRQGSPARLAAWVARTDDIAKAARPELGEIVSMSREHHTWQVTVTKDGSVPLGGAAPMLIQRASSALAAAALPPSGLAIRRLRVRHPSPSRILALFESIDLASHLPVVVTEGSECSLVAEIDTPFGPRELGAT